MNRVRFLPGEIPVPDLAVDWPERRILCSVTMLLGHSDLRRFGSLDFGTKHPDLLDLDTGVVEVAADGVAGRRFLQPSNRELPEVS